MAKSPKCKLCGHEHWNAEAHIFDGPKKPLTPVAEGEAPLTPRERRRYGELKATARESWQIVAAALAEIRDKRLFRADYHSFEAFCQAEMGFSRQAASQLVTAGKVSTMLDSFSLPPPASQRTARALAPLQSDPPAMREAWSETVAKHGPEATAAETAPQVMARITGVTKDAEYEAGLKRLPSSWDPPEPAPVVAVHVSPEVKPETLRALAEVAEAIEAIRAGEIIANACEHHHLVCRDCGEIMGVDG